MLNRGRWLLATFLVARLALALVTVVHPTGGVLTDSGGYLGLARALVREGRYATRPDGEGDMLHPPGYSLILSGMQRVWGLSNPDVTPKVSVLQLILSGATSWLLVLVGIRFGRASAGLIAGWLYALSPNVGVWSLTVMTEITFALGLMLALWITATSKSSPWAVAAGAGVMLGLLAYLRPVAIGLMPVWAAILAWRGWSHHGRRKAILGGATLLAAGALVVLPWAYRNWATYGQFTFSTGMSRAMIGFNLAEVVARAEGTSRNRAVATLDPDLGVARLTLNVLQRYPGPFIKAQALGVARSLVGIDIGTWGNVLGDDSWTGLGLLSGAFWGSLDEGGLGLGERTDPGYRLRVGLLLYSLLHSGALIALAAVGLVCHRAESQSERLFIALAVGSSALMLLLPGAVGNARFRVPAEPYLALLAGYGAVLVWERLQRMRQGRQRAAEPMGAGPTVPP